MVNVLHLITSLGGGGAERQLLTLCRDPDPSIQYSVVSLKEGGELLSAFQETGTYRGHLGMSPGRPSLGSFRTLCQLLKTHQPQVLQTWLYHADLIGTLAARKVKIPRLYWNIRCSDMDLKRYGLSTRLTVKLNGLLSGWPEGLLFNSYAGKTAHETFGFKAKKWVYMPNGFDVSPTEPSLPKQTPRTQDPLRQQWSLPKNSLVLGMVARVDPMKDHETFLKAAATLQKKFPSLHVVLIGKGTSCFQEPFAAPPFNGDGSRLHCLGFQENAASLMTSFDALVLASHFGEGFPNVLGEAMARGIPVFSSDVGDARKIMGRDDHLFPLEDSSSLAQRLSTFFQKSPQERSHIGLSFYKRVQEKYSMEAMRQRYRNLYRGEPIRSLT